MFLVILIPIFYAIIGIHHSNVPNVLLLLLMRHCQFSLTSFHTQFCGELWSIRTSKECNIHFSTAFHSQFCGELWSIRTEKERNIHSKWCQQRQWNSFHLSHGKYSSMQHICACFFTPPFSHQETCTKLHINITFSILFSPQLFFRSTTMTLMLSELFRPKARRVSSAAASTLRDGYSAPAPSSSIRGPELRSIAASGAGVTSRRHSRATSQANSLERTSHKPSLARIKHSSSGSLFVNVISGSDVTNGLRYLSPDERKFENLKHHN